MLGSTRGGGCHAKTIHLRKWHGTHFGAFFFQILCASMSPVFVVLVVVVVSASLCVTQVSRLNECSGNGLVKASAMFHSVLTWISLTSALLQHSLTKWKRLRMCLLR